MTKLPRFIVYMMSIAVGAMTLFLLDFVLEAKPLGIEWNFALWIAVPTCVWLGFVLSYIHGEHDRPDIHAFAATILTAVSYIAFVSLVGSFVYLGSL